MDCNKEEAVRAKGIAERKLQSRDFQLARKMAVSAQQLDPNVDNISQLIMVYDVNCSAEKKFGGETDWYGILQVQQAADEATIKKQYRKFALLLHLDKNKLPGAEAAFKLIGEAQRILLDHTSRAAHDRKRNAISLDAKSPGNFKVGQIWALYSDEDSLSKYYGLSRFSCVHRPGSQGSLRVTLRIPPVEILRFSHQVPAFQLTDQKNSSLRGFWEVDPLALPARLFARTEIAMQNPR